MEENNFVGIDPDAKQCCGKTNGLLFGAGVLFCVFVFLLSLIRAGQTGITYDEAYTYVAITNHNMTDLNTLRQMFSAEGCIANNHWLNSFLVYAADRLSKASYDEFVIRVPSLTVFALYLFCICLFYRKKYYSFPVLILLAGNYFLDEFYGLARGYGMANTFVFLMCICLIRWKRGGYREMKFLNLAMLTASLAVFSNTIVLLLYPAVGLVCLYRLISEKQFGSFLKKSGAVFLVFAAFTVLMGVYHLRVSAAGKPLYTGGGRGFYECFVKGFIRMFVSKDRLVTAGAAAAVCIAGAAFLILLLNCKISDMGIMIVVFILTNIVMQALFRKGYITARVLLPFYAFMVLALSDIFRSAAELLPGKRFRLYAGRAAAVFLCAACILLFVRKIDLRATSEWKDDYKIKTMEIGERMTGKPFDSPLGPAHVFYQEKYHYLIKDYLLLLEESKDAADDQSAEASAE